MLSPIQTIVCVPREGVGVVGVVEAPCAGVCEGVGVVGVVEAPCAGVAEGTPVGVRGEGDEEHPATDTTSSATTQTLISVVSNVLSSCFERTIAVLSIMAPKFLLTLTGIKHFHADIPIR
jgi:hypothetical protein